MLSGVSARFGSFKSRLTLATLVRMVSSEHGLPALRIVLSRHKLRVLEAGQRLKQCALPVPQIGRRQCMVIPISRYRAT